MKDTDLTIDAIEEMCTDFFQGFITQGTVLEAVTKYTRELSQLTFEGVPRVASSLLYPVKIRDFSAMMRTMEARYVLMRLAIDDLHCQKIVCNGYQTIYVLTVPRDGKVYTLHRNGFTGYLSLEVVNQCTLTCYQQFQGEPIRKICKDLEIQLPDFDM